MLRAPRLLTLAVVGLAVAAAHATPLQDLTQDAVRDRLRAYLAANPDTYPALDKEVGVQLTLDPALVTYKADGHLLVPYVVQSTPTEAQQTAAAVALARLMDAVLGEGASALLTPADVQVLHERYRFQPVTTTAARSVYWPSFTPAIAYGPWVSYSPGPIYFTSYGGYPFAVGEYRFAYNSIYYFEPSAFFSYWATWPYRPYGVYAPYYSPYTYWGYWGTYPPNGWATPMGRPVYYLPPAIIKADRPAAETLFAKGYTAYWDGDTAKALEALTAAVAADGQDVRGWYYLALTHRARGDDRAASEAARNGAAARRLYGDKGLGAVLERVQGPGRELLTRTEAGIRDEATAKDIVAARK